MGTKIESSRPSVFGLRLALVEGQRGLSGGGMSVMFLFMEHAPLLVGAGRVRGVFVNVNNRKNEWIRWVIKHAANDRKIKKKKRNFHHQEHVENVF